MAKCPKIDLVSNRRPPVHLQIFSRQAVLIQTQTCVCISVGRLLTSICIGARPSVPLDSFSSALKALGARLGYFLSFLLQQQQNADVITDTRLGDPHRKQ